MNKFNPRIHLATALSAAGITDENNGKGIVNLLLETWESVRNSPNHSVWNIPSAIEKIAKEKGLSPEGVVTYIQKNPLSLVEIHKPKVFPSPKKRKSSYPPIVYIEKKPHETPLKKRRPPLPSNPIVIKALISFQEKYGRLPRTGDGRNEAPKGQNWSNIIQRLRKEKGLTPGKLLEENGHGHLVQRRKKRGINASGIFNDATVFLKIGQVPDMYFHFLGNKAAPDISRAFEKEKVYNWERYVSEGTPSPKSLNEFLLASELVEKKEGNIVPASRQKIKILIERARLTYQTT